MSRRKKKKLRNKFTDALGEEISSRKGLDLEERKKNKPKVDLTKKPKPKIKKAAPAIAEYKVVEEIKVEAKFEERVLAEADNDFHEEKIKRPKRKITSEGRAAPQRPTFRTKTMREKIDEESFDNKKNPDEDAELRRKLTRAEKAGAVLSAVMLMYSLATYDKPLFFLAMSVLSHTLRPLIGAFFGKHNRSVQNALRGFSIALFFGAILFLFL